MKHIIFDERVVFGPNANEQKLRGMMDFCNCCENFELYFALEFSCGDGLFISELDEDEEALDKYDGFVDFFAVPRSDNHIEFEADTEYRFTICYHDDSYCYGVDLRDCTFYIDEIQIPQD